jgi:trimeric autotransporter adhesin
VKKRNFNLAVSAMSLLAYTAATTAAHATPATTAAAHTTKHTTASIPTQTAVHAATMQATAQAIDAIHLRAFKLKPRVTLRGETGDYIFSQGQLLYPLSGNATKTFFGILEGSKTFNSHGIWFAGVGAGYRQVVDKHIYGGYATINHLTSPYNNHFFVANLGLELLGKEWDFRLNGYIPLTGSKRKIMAIIGWAEDFGITQYVEYYKHTGTDKTATLDGFESAGRGFDFAIARVIPKFEQAKFSLGGYYFNAQDTKSITGVAAKLSYNVNKYTSFELTHTYDNYFRNKTLAGIKITFGGYNDDEKKTFGAASRLLDPLEHGYNNTIVPIAAQTNITINDRKIRYNNNLWWYDDNAATARKDSTDTGDGTFEHPFKNFSLANYNIVYANRNMGASSPVLFLKTGEYSLAEFTGSDGSPYTFQLPAGWSIYGRGANSLRAIGNDRPILRGSLEIYVPRGTSGGESIIDSIRLLRPVGSNATNSIGMSLTNAGNITLRNVTIGASTSANSGYENGLETEGTTINLYDTMIYGASHNGSATGIVATTSTVNFIGGTNTIYAYSAIDDASITGLVMALDAEQTTINFNGGTNNVTALTDITVPHTSHMPDHLGFAHRRIPTAIPTNTTAVLAMNAYNSTINFYDGNNNIATTTAINGTYAPSGLDLYTIGIEAYLSSTINFLGGNNNISTNTIISNSQDVTGDPWLTAGITTWDATINFISGTNNISANTQTDSNIPLQTFAITAEASSQVNFNGGTNSITAIKDSAATNDGTDASVGALYAYYKSIINFNGGTNYLSASNTSASNTTNGIMIENGSMLSFNGGNNRIEVGSYGTGGASASHIATAIEVYDKSTLNFVGGVNAINAVVNAAGGTASLAKAAGIIADDAYTARPSTVNFSGGTNSISLAVIGAGNTTQEAIGIFMGTVARLLQNGVTVIAPGQLSTLVGRYLNLSRAAGTYTDNTMIERVGIDDLQWE